MTKRIVVNVFEGAPGWRWIADRLDKTNYEWVGFTATPTTELARKLNRPNTSRYRACWNAIASVKALDATLLVTHRPLITAWCAMIAQLRGVKVRHLAFAFTFSELPTGLRLRMMKRAYASVDRFVCFSGIERRRYAKLFDIPIEKIDVLRWSVGEPDFDADEPPIIPGDYLCAIGGEGRDYATLVEAMRGLPDLKLAIVARPANVAGLDLPDNVIVKTNIPLSDVWNITHNARLMVLPLSDTEVPCGHGTLIMAMQLRVPCIVTESLAMTDYVHPGKTALVCPPGRPQAMAATVRQLWDDEATRRSLIAAGRTFAIEECSEARTVEYFTNFVDSVGR